MGKELSKEMMEVFSWGSCKPN